MDYDLYTVPRCEQCDAVKEFFDEQNISYNVWNLKEPEHKKYFGKNGYLQIDGKLKRNVSNNKPLLPLLVERNNGTVERFAQQIDDIKAMFG